MTKTERKLTSRQVFNVQWATFNIYVTDGTYTIVLEDCVMFDRDLELDEFDEILEQLQFHTNDIDEEFSDGWKLVNAFEYI
jgi:hypothetical protein